LVEKTVVINHSGIGRLTTYNVRAQGNRHLRKKPFRD